MTETLTNLVIVLVALIAPYLGYRVYNRRRKEKEQMAEINQRLRELTYQTATAAAIVETCDELMIGLNCNFEPWIDSGNLGYVHGRLLTIKGISENLILESTIEGLASKIKRFDLNYRNHYLLGISKVNPKYGSILQSFLS